MSEEAVREAESVDPVESVAPEDSPEPQPPTRVEKADAPEREFGPHDAEPAPPVAEPRPGELVVDPLDPSVPQRRRPVPFAAHRYELPWIDPDDGSWKTGSEMGVLTVSLFTELYLAADMDAKVFRVTVQGSGFGVNLRKDGWDERGAFQDSLTLSVGPRALDPLWMGVNSPPTENEDAAFTSTAKTTVKVQPDYEKSSAGIDVSSSVSTRLLDFRVRNQSDDRVGKWTWDMTKMGANVAKWTYPYEGPSSLIGMQGWVYPVAPLATSTLFPACTAFWYAPADFNGTVTFDLWMSQRLGYALTRTWAWTGYGYAGNYPVSRLWPFQVSFSDSTLEPRP